MQKKVYDWCAVQRFHDEGNDPIACRERFHIKYAAWRKAVKSGRLRLSVDFRGDQRRRHNWAAIQAYYDEGRTYAQCRATFQFAAESWAKAVRRGAITPRNRDRSIATVLSSRSSRYAKKLKLVREGILRNECYQCGIGSWQGRPLAIQIDHINGKPDDWALENLRMLCPNCHSQTETFGGRNIRNRKSLQDPPSVV